MSQPRLCLLPDKFSQLKKCRPRLNDATQMLTDGCVVPSRFDFYHSERLKIDPPMQNSPIATVIEADNPKSIVMFAAGRGGHPMRHLPFLTALARRGNRIVAPHFEMLKTAVPGKAELDARIEIMDAAIQRHALGTLPLMGIGHSIGAVVLLAMAGGRGETLAGERFAAKRLVAFRGLALFAPPTDFFRRPGAVHDVRTPIEVWIGAKDTITPPDQALFLKSALNGQVAINVHIDDEAGHFTYMNELPPGMVDTHPDRSTYLMSLSEEVARFIENP